jgi:hypothetical protein
MKREWLDLLIVTKAAAQDSIAAAKDVWTDETVSDYIARLLVEAPFSQDKEPRLRAATETRATTIRRIYALCMCCCCCCCCFR